MDPQLQKLLFDILSTFLGALAVIVAPLVARDLVRWVHANAQTALNRLKATNPDLYAELEAGAKMVVLAAEGSGAAQAAKNLVFDKKEYAITALQAYLKSKGFENIDLKAIDAAVEAAVYTEINYDKEYKPAS